MRGGGKRTLRCLKENFTQANVLASPAFTGTVLSKSLAFSNGLCANLAPNIYASEWGNCIVNFYRAREGSGGGGVLFADREIALKRTVPERGEKHLEYWGEIKYKRASFCFPTAQKIKYFLSSSLPPAPDPSSLLLCKQRPCLLCIQLLCFVGGEWKKGRIFVTNGVFLKCPRERIFLI